MFGIESDQCQQAALHKDGAAIRPKRLVCQGFVLDVDPEQGEIGSVGIVTALGVDDAVILIVAKPLVLGLRQAFTNTEQVTIKVTKRPPWVKMPVTRSGL